MHKHLRSGISLAISLVLSITSLHAGAAEVTEIIRLDTSTRTATPRQLLSIQREEFDMSADGRYVAFMSSYVSGGSSPYFRELGKSDVVAHDLNLLSWATSGVDFSEQNLDFGNDLFVYDRVEKKYELVSRISNGRNNQMFAVYDVTISGDGRYVAYINSGNDALLEDDNMESDVDHSGEFPDTTQTFNTYINVFDRLENKSYRLTTHDGQQTDNNAYFEFGANSALKFSGDGKYLFFQTNAQNVAPDPVSSYTNIYRYDFANNTYERANLTDTGVPRSNSSVMPGVSFSGNHVVFQSYISPEDTFTTGAYSPAYMWKDMTTGDLKPIDISSTGEGGNGSGYDNPSVSADGRYAVFASSSTNLTPDATNGTYNIFLRDMQALPGDAGFMTLISKNSSGTEGDQSSYTPSISADGSKIIFTSEATNLVPNDTNGIGDLFSYDVATGLLERVSVDKDGNESTEGASWDKTIGRISSDGSVISLLTTAKLSALDVSKTGGITFDSFDIYVYDQNSTDPDIEMASLVYNGHPDSRTKNPSVSGDGNLIAFESATNQLTSDPAVNYSKIYLYNKTTGATTLVSKAAGGGLADGNSKHAKISKDGQYIVFSSDATNLRSVADNSSFSVYLYTVATDSIALISKTPTGDDTGIATYPAFSADGSAVSYTSSASDIVPNDTNGVNDVFHYDIASDTTTRVSVDSAGIEQNPSPNWWENVQWSAMSADGRKVFFHSYAANLIPNDTNGVGDIFMHDLDTNQTIRVNEAPGGGQSTKSVLHPSVSEDGNLVVYQEERRSGNRILLTDIAAGTTQVINPTAGHAPHSVYFQYPVISGNGEYITFESFADNVVAGDTNRGWDVFQYHIPTATTVRLSQQMNGTEAERGNLNPFYTAAGMSTNGRTIAFVSDSRNIVPGDTEMLHDLFITSLEQAVVSFSTPSSTVTESDGTQNVSITISGGELLTDRTVTVSVTGGTATSGDDYTFTSPATITIPAGDYRTPQTIDVPFTILTDAVLEPSETIIFSVSSSDPDITLGTQTSTTVTITDVAPPIVPPVIPPVVPATGGGGGGGFSEPTTPVNETRPSGEVPSEQSTTNTNSNENTPSVSEELRFNDITRHWAQRTITNLALQCGLSGYRSEHGEPTKLFRPDNNITRAELIVMLMRCVESEVPRPTVAPFPDVPVEHWSSPWVARAKELGLIHGYGDGLYRPDNFASTAEATKIILLTRYPMENIKHVSLQSVCKPMLESAWYVPYMSFALNMGHMDKPLVEGKETERFCDPEKMITRAETARVIENVRMLNVYDTEYQLTETMK